MLEPSSETDAKSIDSSDSDSSSDNGSRLNNETGVVDGPGQQQATPTTTGRDGEELVTRLQLRLSASHLPKIGGKRVAFAKRSPSTFATVASIVKRQSREGNAFRESNSSSQAGPKPANHEYGSTSLSALPGLDDDFMVEWGSTEMYVLFHVSHTVFSTSGASLRLANSCCMCAYGCVGMCHCYSILQY